MSVDSPLITASKRLFAGSAQWTGAKRAGSWMGDADLGLCPFKPLVESSSLSALTRNVLDDFQPVFSLKTRVLRVFAFKTPDFSLESPWN